MCNYTIHIPLSTLHTLVQTRNPMTALTLLNDIRVLDCKTQILTPCLPSSSTSRFFTAKPAVLTPIPTLTTTPSCTTITLKNIKVVTDATSTCPMGCTKRHRDGFHVDKKVFGKVLGVQAASWVKDLVKDLREKRAIRAKEEKAKALMSKEQAQLSMKESRENGEVVPVVIVQEIEDVKAEGEGTLKGMADKGKWGRKGKKVEV